MKKKVSKHAEPTEVAQDAPAEVIPEVNKAIDDGEGLKKPKLIGKPKPLPKKFEQPGTNNQSRTIEE